MPKFHPSAAPGSRRPVPPPHPRLSEPAMPTPTTHPCSPASHPPVCRSRLQAARSSSPSSSSSLDCCDAVAVAAAAACCAAVGLLALLATSAGGEVRCSKGDSSDASQCAASTLHTHPRLEQRTAASTLHIHPRPSSSPPRRFSSASISSAAVMYTCGAGTTITASQVSWGASCGPWPSLSARSRQLSRGDAHGKHQPAGNKQQSTTSRQ